MNKPLFNDTSFVYNSICENKIKHKVFQTRISTAKRNPLTLIIGVNNFQIKILRTKISGVLLKKSTYAQKFSNNLHFSLSIEYHVDKKRHLKSFFDQSIKLMIRPYFAKKNYILICSLKFRYYKVNINVVNLRI